MNITMTVLQLYHRTVITIYNIKYLIVCFPIAFSVFFSIWFVCYLLNSIGLILHLNSIWLYLNSVQWIDIIIITLYFYFIISFCWASFLLFVFFTFCCIDSLFHWFLLFFIISEQPYELGIKLPSTYCDRVFEDCSQNNKKKCKIRSPNWPGFYNRNITCKFRIRHHGQVPKGHKIRIVISQVSQTERIKHLEIDDMTKHWHKDIA